MSKQSPEGYSYSETDVDRYMHFYNANMRQNLIREAQIARDELALSYRDFKVGCAVVSIKKSLEGVEEIKYHSAGNFTPEDKKKMSEAKWCAERTSVHLALAEDGVFIPAIVTVSDRVDTGGGEDVHDVLHPCYDCRKLLRQLIGEKIMSPESKICCVNDKDHDNLQVDERTVEELLRMYPNEDDL